MKPDRNPAYFSRSSSLHYKARLPYLKKKRQRKHSSYESIPFGILDVSFDGKFLDVNQELCRLLGYDRDELLLLGDADITHPDDHQAETGLIEQLLTGKVSFYKIEKRLLHKDGHVVWVELMRSVGEKTPGKSRFTTAMVTDVTQRRSSASVLEGLTRQQQALYRFAERLNQTSTLEQVLNAALDGILTGLQCDRASILLADESGVMHFTAWRGLSDEYRRVTDGHSPWAADEPQPTPICMDDIDVAVLSDTLRTVIKGEGIAALAFIPLVFEGKLIGKFMTYYDSPHQYTQQDTDFSLLVARQLAAGVERQRTVQALRASELLYRAIAQNIPGGGVYVVDKDFRYIVAEGSVTEKFGLSREWLEGHTIYEALPPDQSARMEARFRRNLSGETVSFETTYNDRVYWTRQALLSQPADHIIIITMDITERKQMEEALRESESRFRAILNQATAGIVRKQLDGKLLFVNDAFCDMLGYSSSELVGKSIWEFTHVDDQDENRRSYALLMKDGQPFQLEKRLIRRDGSVIWVNASVSPIMDGSGKPQSAVAVEVDITARKRAEESLQELNTQLENLVEKRTAQLRFSNDALQRNRRRLVEVQEDERRALARELHDRVGQSLTALTLNLGVLQDQLPVEVKQKVGTKLADSIKLLEETIPAVRDVMSNLRPAVLDEYGLLAALRLHVDEFKSRYNIRADFSSPASIPPRLDNTVEVTLLRICQESLMNVVKHAQANGVKISFLQDDKAVCLTVEDDGLGFDMVERSVSSNSHGLNIMTERAEALGGSILISSQVGKGTRVEVTIPL